MKDEQDLKIIIAPDERLRRRAEGVDVISDETISLINEMKDIMHRSNGIGLAATQVGVLKRVIVLDVDRIDAYEDMEATTHGQFEMINPTIIEMSGEVNWKEGCLSVPGAYENVSRSQLITVKYTRPDGATETLRAAGLLSACIQHEIDHLDGKLFIDRISRLKKDLIISKLKKLQKRSSFSDIKL